MIIVRNFTIMEAIDICADGTLSIVLQESETLSNIECKPMIILPLFLTVFEMYFVIIALGNENLWNKWIDKFNAVQSFNMEYIRFLKTYLPGNSLKMKLDWKII